MEAATGMEALVTALKGAISATELLGVITSLIGVIAGVLVFAFTYRLIRRILSGAQKGKAKI